MLQCSPEGGFREWENTLGGGVLRRVVLGDGRTPLWTAVVSRTLFWKIFEKIESFCEHFAPQNATNNTENKSIKIALRGAKNDPQGSKMKPKGCRRRNPKIPGQRSMFSERRWESVSACFSDALDSTVCHPKQWVCGNVAPRERRNPSVLRLQKDSPKKSSKTSQE